MNILDRYYESLKKENRVLSYWDNAFKDDPEKYMKDIPSERFVSYKDRKKIRDNRLCSEENFLYSNGSFDRVLRWRGIPLYKNIYDFTLYPTILTQIQPKTIIELGTGDGASCIWYKDILYLHSLKSKIITFDLYKPIEYFNEWIDYRQFDLNNIDMISFSNYPHPWLIIEDCHVNLEGILNYFDEHTQPNDYIIIEDNTQKKQKTLDNFMSAHNNYYIDTYYSDFYGYNNCSFCDSIFKKL
tara:strand:- start:1210 stop:1935 length:726 start_codon:yes stop_codon:yes gene_type:complete